VKRITRLARERARLRPAHSRITGSNLLQTAVTILVAVALAIAALTASGATDRWQSSVREEVKRSAGIVEDVRAVYGDEAPMGLDVALADARARQGADDDALTERQVVFAIRKAHRGKDHLIADDRYLRPTGAYDVPRRLADVGAKDPDFLRLDPDRTARQGDDKRGLATLMALVTIPLVLLYLLTELVLRARARRRPASARADEVGLVPRPWSSPATSRLGVSVALVAWLAVALLPVLQLRLDTQEQRANAEASRGAVDVSTMLAASGIAFSFRLHSQQRVLALETHAVGRQLVALYSPDHDAGARLMNLGRAETQTAHRAQLVVAGMSRAPTARDGVDPATLRAVNASPAATDAVRVEQNRQADLAERAGKRTNRVNLALLLSALTLSLAALAATGRDARLRGIDRVAAAILVAALAVAASAVFA
jgi:type II secretory pathway pseudopilin PulG